MINSFQLEVYQFNSSTFFSRDQVWHPALEISHETTDLQTSFFDSKIPGAVVTDLMTNNPDDGMDENLALLIDSEFNKCQTPEYLAEFSKQYMLDWFFSINTKEDLVSAIRAEFREVYKARLDEEYSKYSMD